MLIPGALPSIFTGLRLSLQASWTTLVAAELVGAVAGLGQILNQAAQDIYPAMILVGMVSVALCGWLMTLGLGLDRAPRDAVEGALMLEPRLDAGALLGAHRPPARRASSLFWSAAALVGLTLARRSCRRRGTSLARFGAAGASSRSPATRCSAAPAVELRSASRWASCSRSSSAFRSAC